MPAVSQETGEFEDIVKMPNVSPIAEKTFRTWGLTSPIWGAVGTSESVACARVTAEL